MLTIRWGVMRGYNKEKFKSEHMGQDVELMEIEFK
ncbi:uncharacterized protein METZ01_LOCUS500338 [marine metagenome]|uniref:Uncharacterized protein n=1 Tax=marine metagenome TaxID=408172 RepID=A0A383DT46_9ZZZZ